MSASGVAVRLNALVDDDPEAAISEASNLGGDFENQLLKAAIFVDAGAATNNKMVIESGIEIFQSVLKEYPLSYDLVYNLGNGYHALAIATPYSDFSWYQETNANRQKARSLFYRAASGTHSSKDTKSQSLTNLANIHWASYRWVEAYDFYMKALEENPNNGVASSGALKMLRYAIAQNMGDEELLSQEIERLAAHVKSNIETIQAYAGTSGVKGVLGEIEEIPEIKREASLLGKDCFLDFVIRNNLALSPTIHSFQPDISRWDDLSISSVTVKTSDGGVVPEIFAMFNVIKSDYILARHILFGSSSRDFADSGAYGDTLDYACYGVNESALALAQRVALDILDKVAVASLSYLGVGGARSTSFKSAWFKDEPSGKKFSSKILKEIEAGNAALLALSEMSNDLSDSEQGYLYEKQQARNSTTHRFTVLHDFGSLPESRSRCIEHYDYDEFSRETMSTLKLARSAIIYLVQMVNLREQRAQRLHDDKGDILMPMIVPSHHNIRDFDD